MAAAVSTGHGMKKLDEASPAPQRSHLAGFRPHRGPSVQTAECPRALLELPPNIVASSVRVRQTPDVGRGIPLTHSSVEFLGRVTAAYVQGSRPKVAVP